MYELKCIAKFSCQSRAIFRKCGFCKIVNQFLGFHRISSSKKIVKKFQRLFQLPCAQNITTVMATFRYVHFIDAVLNYDMKH